MVDTTELILRTVITQRHALLLKGADPTSVVLGAFEDKILARHFKNLLGEKTSKSDTIQGGRVAGLLVKVDGEVGVRVL